MNNKSIACDNHSVSGNCGIAIGYRATAKIINRPIDRPKQKPQGLKPWPFGRAGE